MNVLRGRLVPVLLAAVVVTGGVNIAAYAANGRPLLLGSSNSETKPATVSNSGSGSALTLNTSLKSPPLTVNSPTLVRNLNADTVDGRKASSLGVNVKRFVLTNGDTHFNLTGLSPGTYLVSADVLLTNSSMGNVSLHVDSSLVGVFYGITDGISDAVVSGTTLLTFTSGQTVTVTLNGPASSGTGFTSQVLFTPVSQLSDGNVSGS